MIETIEFQGEIYPAFQTNGNAARFCIPFALEVCKGFGYDIGCGKEEWKFPGAAAIDLNFDTHAESLPSIKVDYIFSSHCLEHITDWVTVLKHWTDKIKPGGTLFLYLPHYSQKYWRPWNNLKHKNIFTPEIMQDSLHYLGYKNVFVSECDLYNSFMVMAEKI